ncbi:MAG: histidine phosphatase family protein [Candidatus Saccharimonadales bacterium]
MNLYLARHAETNYNVLGLSNSDPKVDVHLTALGIRQAKELGVSLKNERLDAVYISELSRTAETTRYITEGRGLKIISDSRLNDLNMGFEGKPVNDYHAKLSLASDMWSAKFNSGESLNDLNNRVASFLAYLSELGGEKNILVVSHYTVLQLMIGQIKHLDKNDALKIEITQGQYSKIALKNFVINK